MSDSVKKVSLNQIIGNVIGNLGLKNTNNLKDDFARWACEAENKIGSTSSYRRFECELVVKNRKATLPPNFVYLNAMKVGNQFIPITKRSFRMFNKGPEIQAPTQNSSISNPSTISCNNVIGVPLVIAVNLSGAFMAGDLINITITHNNCGAISSNTFNYVVTVGQSLSDIALAITTQINAITNLGYSATPGNDQFFITGDSPENNFQVTLYTDSATGFLSQSVTQKRVPTKKETNTVTKGSSIQTHSNNLASPAVENLNTGINAQGVSGIYGYSYNYDDNINASVFSIDNGCINFNAVDDTRIGISYMGIDLDEDGWPMISEIHEDAVTHYIMYMYKSIDFYNDKMSVGAFDRLERRWFDLCGQARGDDELPNSEELKYLSNMWMQLVPLPSKEIF